MGRSDKLLQPHYERMFNNLIREKPIKNIACLGAPKQYFVSAFVEKLCKKKCDYYDLLLKNWNINSAWSLKTTYDLIFSTRCPFFAKNPSDFMKRCYYSLSEEGLLFLDWNYGHFFEKEYRVGFKKNELQEFWLKPDNFVWSGVWDESFRENNEFKLFERRLKPYNYTDAVKAIFEETPQVYPISGFKNNFTIKTELLAIWEENPLLYVFLQGKKKSLKLI